MKFGAWRMSVWDRGHDRSVATHNLNTPFPIFETSTYSEICYKVQNNFDMKSVTNSLPRHSKRPITLRGHDWSVATRTSVNFRQTFMNPNLFSNLLQTSKQLCSEFCNKLSPQICNKLQNNFG